MFKKCVTTKLLLSGALLLCLYKTLWLIQPQEIEVKYCLLYPVELRGAINVTRTLPVNTDLTDLAKEMRKGGFHYQNDGCKSNTTVAILVPFKNRAFHLPFLLANLIPVLKRQQINFNIFVIEQAAKNTVNSSLDLFNKGILYNAGFLEANKIHNFDCFIFHDIDLLPENDKNLYRCSQTTPIHMSVALDKFNYKLPYDKIFGGIVAFTNNQYKKVNGFSNEYWGWGGEDDDLYYRVRLKGMKIMRPSPEFARYSAIIHPQSIKNPNRYVPIPEMERKADISGLNSVKYNLLRILYDNLYTRIVVEIPSKSTF